MIAAYSAHLGISPAAKRDDWLPLGTLIENEAAASAAFTALGGINTDHSRALHALAEQAIHRGIDYASLGLNWDHPTSRIHYRNAAGTSFSKPASRDRQSRSRLTITSLVASLAALPAPAVPQAEGLLVAEYCIQIGSPEQVANATFAGVLAALDGELLLPMRAFNEGRTSMYTTFNGHPVPHAPVDTAVTELVAATLAGRFAEWRYTNPAGIRQLDGLSAAQISKWREATSSMHGVLRVHEDEPGEVRT